MFSFIGMTSRLTIAFALIVSLAAQPSGAQESETLRGHIIAVDGPLNIRIRDDRGYIDYVELHQGTIINPTGLKLEFKMQVTITGYHSGTVFEAEKIDTHFTFAGPPPI